MESNAFGDIWKQLFLFSYFGLYQNNNNVLNREFDGVPRRQFEGLRTSKIGLEKIMKRIPGDTIHDRRVNLIIGISVAMITLRLEEI